jgi:hypothetical protein
MTRNDTQAQLDTIWNALHIHRDCCQEGAEESDAEWDEICTAMAWIAEDLGVGETGHQPERLDNFDPAGH